MKSPFHEEPAEEEILRGLLERVTYANEDNGYSVFKIRADGESELVPAVGIACRHMPGEELEFVGHWAVHPKFGVQFQFSECRPLLPSTIDGIRKYLSSGLIKGIRAETANRIIAQFGESSLDILDNDPDELLKVKGIGRKTLDSIKRSWVSQRAVSAVMYFLKSNGIGPGFAARIYKEYGDQAIAVLKENPYKLADDVFGIGFLTADKFAANMGVPRDSAMRTDAGMRYALGTLTEEGHVCVPRDVLAGHAAKLLDISPVCADASVGRAIEASALVGETGAGGEETVESVYLPMYYVFESKSAQMMARLLKSRSEDDIIGGYAGIDSDAAIADAERAMGIKLAENQREAVRLALSSKVMIITGGPGTGKTTILKAIIRILGDRGVKTSLAAPTGRAAKKMSEATGMNALTIHRLLESDGFRFARDENLPLECRLLIIDEISMVDIHIMYRTLCALRPEAHLILVGDVHQLPSVGPGSVLRDLLSSGVIPVAELNVIFRQARDSGIIVNAHRVNSGLLPEDRGGARLRDFYIIEQDDPSKCLEIILSLVRDRIPKRFGLDPVEDVQVLTPMHDGILGASNLNAVIRGELNSGPGNTLTVGKREFKTGDKVMQIANNYEKEVYNGDIGVIKTIDPAARLVTVKFDDAEPVYEAESMGELIHAYAVSIHKSQGSEYPAVIMPIHTQHYFLLQRNLLYTGITRAKELAVLVGTKRALAMAVKNDRTGMRYTHLASRLRSALC
ncbi:MAG: ATP-dependent RecD-like DNA helicase [Synergistaceae bacterium]|jgi:exodeoxyribonuclease V alpha subunit|nr:ATP-dependent RecD-like DNA helicase [Synergistaceae bacterium]